MASPAESGFPAAPPHSQYEAAIPMRNSPEYRQDPLSGSWVILARARAERPTEFVAQPVRRRLEHCPFCAGNERFTPRAVATYPAAADSQADNHRWQVRVIPNKFPAVIESAPDIPDCGAAADRLAPLPGYGVHEVIVESREHTSSFSELSAEQARWSLLAYRDRLRCLANDSRLAYALLFKNCRGGGGATLEHTHSQIVGTSLTPAVVQRELQAAAEFHDRHRDCIFCRMVRSELDQAVRLVASTARFVAFCPFASRFPYEVWMLPREHAARYEDASLGDLDELSALLQLVLRSLEKNFSQVPYNYWIHTSPFDSAPFDYYHWHIELIPRITSQAGFEFGTGCFMNPVAPEDAASTIRVTGI
jgi:UDPglucose--hexose-1-phosphate uridylyltransferase